MIIEKYSARLFSDSPVWKDVEEGVLNYSNWDTTVMYDTRFKLCLVKNKGIYLRMRTNETDLRKEVSERDGSVWEDSCMEFFFKPFDDYDEYINIEMNPVGAYLSAIGSNRDNRVFLKEITDICPVVSTEINSEGWSLELFVPFELINAVFKNKNFENINLFRANFYKCGDKTNKIHYHSFSKMTTLPPGFHNPECFGLVEVKER